MQKIKPCPNCKSTKITIWHVCYPNHFKYFAECDDCYWCGKTKLFKWRAIRAWNREANEKI